MDENQTSAKDFNRGRWNKEERNRFSIGYMTYKSNWKAVAEVVGTRSAVQVRSHAQKALRKLERFNPKQFEPTSNVGHSSQSTEHQPLPASCESALYKNWLYHSVLANYCLNAINRLPGNSKQEEGHESKRDHLAAQNEF